MLYFKNLERILHCISHIGKLLKNRTFSLLSSRDSRREATAEVARQVEVASQSVSQKAWALKPKKERNTDSSTSMASDVLSGRAAGVTCLTQQDNHMGSYTGQLLPSGTLIQVSQIIKKKYIFWG